MSQDFDLKHYNYDMFNFIDRCTDRFGVCFVSFIYLSQFKQQIQIISVPKTIYFNG